MSQNDVITSVRQTVASVDSASGVVHTSDTRVAVISAPLVSSVVTATDSVVVTKEVPDVSVVGSVEQRTVVTKDVVAEVVAGTAQGVPGPPGPPGAAGSTYVQVPTNAPVSGNKIVFSHNGACEYASCYNVMSAVGALGITARAETSGLPVDVQVSGEMVEPGWNWQPGFVFLGVDGTVTQSVPSDATVSLVIGRVISPKSILIQVGRPVVMA